MKRRSAGKDLIKFHGHFRGGLVESARAPREAFSVLFPDGIVALTDLRIVSRNSACGGSDAAYPTEAKLQLGTHPIELG
jgi:formylmethanofuran dehydrogenase subunit E